VPDLVGVDTIGIIEQAKRRSGLDDDQGGVVADAVVQLLRQRDPRRLGPHAFDDEQPARAELGEPWLEAASLH
jgi:hypothetical protein